ncbi:MAG: macro domain-containing protein [Oscillospiraceae bacterium]|nr:macro domain-containing protein [Oscillospiraceae bacterium]
MSFDVTRDDILSVNAEAAVACVENRMVIAESISSERLAESGGESFLAALGERKFLPVGSVDSVEFSIAQFRHIILAATPRWENAQGNEILILRFCYQRIFQEAERLGCSSVAMPFLSTYYYCFPKEDAVRTALFEAEKTQLHVVFIAETSELYELSRREYRKPEIRSYIGYYRDYAIFELDNGQFVRIDIRPENTEVTRILYFEPCYRVGHDPKQPPLPEYEINRLRTIFNEKYN